MLYIIAGNSGRTKGDKENVRLLESSVRDVEKGSGIISRIIVKANKKLKPRKNSHTDRGEDKSDTSSESSDESTCTLETVTLWGPRIQGP